MERNQKATLGVALLLLLCFFLYAAYPTFVGTNVQLQLAPVDPTDIFRGEYLILRYELSTIDASLPKDYDLNYGDTIYVTLSDEPIRKATAYSHVPPEGLYIKGMVNGQSIVYGIEQYFIPEKSGTILDGSYTALVKIDGRGNARVTKILKNGEPVTFTYQGRMGN